MIKRGEVFSVTADAVTVPGINDGDEHHLAITREGNFVRYYVDGALVGGIEMSDEMISVDSDNWIGRSHFTPSDFNGTIRDFKVWNYALGTSEIQSIFNQG